MKNFKTSLPVLFFAALFLICACSQPHKSAAYYAEAQKAELSFADDGADNNYGARQSSGGSLNYEDSEEALNKAELAGQSRKLVKNAYLNIRVEDPAATEEPLSKLMEKFGAWPASTAIYGNSRNYSIRVPSGSYSAMLSELGNLGRITRQTENTEDVTLRYYDLEGRLAVKRELLNTYKGYLGKARNIDEIMTVESRIADLQQEIDWTGTQLRNLTNLVDYSTVNLDVTGPSGSSYSPPTLAERFGSLFSSFGDVFSTSLVVLAGIIMYGVPALLVVILLFWVLFGRIGLVKKLWRLAARK